MNPTTRAETIRRELNKLRKRLARRRKRLGESAEAQEAFNFGGHLAQEAVDSMRGEIKELEVMIASLVQEREALKK